MEFGLKWSLVMSIKSQHISTCFFVVTLVAARQRFFLFLSLCTLCSFNDILRPWTPWWKQGLRLNWQIRTWRVLTLCISEGWLRELFQIKSSSCEGIQILRRLPLMVSVSVNLGVGWRVVRLETVWAWNVDQALLGRLDLLALTHDLVLTFIEITYFFRKTKHLLYQQVMLSLLHRHHLTHHILAALRLLSLKRRRIFRVKRRRLLQPYLVFLTSALRSRWSCPYSELFLRRRGHQLSIHLFQHLHIIHEHCRISVLTSDLRLIGHTCLLWHLTG